ncbi:AAA family ATPase [Chryseobacterium sp. NKUCC03_KSP]|uniref:AAA family ATPase n=1 Tax=Chryseobacterium sp. NKUCC03_KSP TaxID=2842125 RepID=UPI001C5BE2E1|nr:AAA family ATPase [Chryseobacterium sp. NKUCC03_KSP]MBW3521636.1 AAA family ATPase [Chryseobacterium sp. NKUCC03_KSP]
MKFNKIFIPKSITQNKGLEEISIERLKNVVVFVGKNGSGKTRILDLICENAISSILITDIISNSIENSDKIDNIKIRLKKYEDIFKSGENLKNIQIQLENNPSDSRLSREMKKVEKLLNLNTIGINQNEFQTLINELNRIRVDLKKKYIKRIYSKDIQQLKKAIDDNEFASFENLVENLVENLDFDEVQAINATSLAYLSKLPHQLAFDFYECTINSSSIEDKPSYKKYISLKGFVKNFLDKDLTWEQELSQGKFTAAGNNVTFSGKWMLNNRIFDYSELSDGEKTLFAYGLLMFLLDQNPNLNIKDSVIIVDEPELHLHPNSEIDLFEGLKKVVGEKGQLIIATHSINILSTLNYDEIFMVKNGVITHPSNNTPSESLSELMGLEDRIHRLTDFLTSISTWSYVNFMAQCFSNPEVIESAKENDPQIETFKNIVKNHMNKNSNLLLDFGAGKGRVLEQIKKDYSFMNKISYSALEPDLEFHEQLKNLGTKDIYISHNNLPKNSFDFILLCNVLHEIPINDWEESLNKIIDSLTPEGYLIIIEAKTLSKGEKIGNIGYLLLDLEEIKELFDLKDLPSSLKVQKNIICTILNKRELKNISKQNIIKCLTALEKNTFNKLEIIRNDNLEVNHLYSIGRNSAFLSQQHINAKFAIKHIQNN